MLRSTQTALLAALLLTCGGAASAVAQTPATAAVATVQPTEEVRRADLVADYFAADPATASRGAVIVLGGSEGGLGGSGRMARRLAADGFDAVAVSYFGEPGQTEALDLIPIEPVDRAVAWLNARPGTPEPVAIVGVSKGGELALLVASRNPAIAAVVAAVPSNVVWAGIDRTGGAVGSSWTAGGQPLPHVPYDFSKGFTGIFNLYRDSLPPHHRRRKSRSNGSPGRSFWSRAKPTHCGPRPRWPIASKPGCGRMASPIPLSTSPIRTRATPSSARRSAPMRQGFRTSPP
jgi:hypothetical protein